MDISLSVIFEFLIQVPEYSNTRDCAKHAHSVQMIFHINHIYMAFSFTFCKRYAFD